jgi:predicted short-subunit dehydrogenase-like oxidoreductase (DUF2520 family)
LGCVHHADTIQKIDDLACYSAVVKPSKSISFVGAGALANGLAKSLHAQGFPIAEIIVRSTASSKRKGSALARSVGAESTVLANAKLNCDVLWLAVPDEAIGDVSQTLAGHAELPHIVLHASGALSSLALGVLSERGVHAGSAHPMMTFVAGESPSLEGAWFAVEGSPVAVRAARAMASRLGANSFSIKPGEKALYHAFGAMLSPMLATELAAAEQLGLRAGISAKNVRCIMEPIVLRTVRNVLRNGAGKSFSGPLARGDVRTVESHLESLGNSPESFVYRALMEYATGMLPVKRSDEMQKLLRRRGARARK